MHNAIELTEVTKRFGHQTAVDRLDLAVPEGSIYGFIGPNGSGKTTTLRLILRIFQPDSGRVVVLGSDRGSVADDRLGYLPEERGMYKRMKVIDLITYFARLKGHFNCRGDVNQWLERLDAASWAHKKIDALSKGMSQKVQFIVAVVARPKLLILDEAFSGLDPVNLDMIKDAVLWLRQRGATIVLSTHDMNVAEQMCDTIFMIFQGRKVLDGSLASIQRDYPLNRVKVRLSPDRTMPAELPEVEAVDQTEDGWIVRLGERCPPQALLRTLVQATDVEHFEVIRPSLHDIFVDIAKPRNPETKP